MTTAEATRLAFSWEWWARDDQLPPPGDWFIWLMQWGRGSGKTRTGAEWIRDQIDNHGVRIANLAGATWTDVIDTMVLGVDEAPGLAKLWPHAQRPELKLAGQNPHLRCHNGAIVRLRAAQKAERFRGPQAAIGWCDEVDAWQPERMSQREAFALFEMGIRLGDDPRIVVTSTPKPSSIVESLRERADVITTRASMYANPHLADQFVKVMEQVYGGTRFGRQEIEGELISAIEGAILSHDQIEKARASQTPHIGTVVVAVDPAGSSNASADEWGIVGAGTDERGDLFTLADRSKVLKPSQAARRAIALYDELGADLMVAEVNYGGEMVEELIRQQPGGERLRFKVVRATRGKHVRAMPVLALYEQGRAHHVGRFPILEDELCAFTQDGYEGSGSPNRADALVWAATELCLGGVEASWGDFYGRRSPLTVARVQG